jgi:formate--tetrahydrofolate ligase
MPTDAAIAHQFTPRPIEEIADKLGIAREGLVPFGRDKAKIDLQYYNSLPPQPDGKLVLVTAINPTPAGEGKTTTTIGLTDGLNAIGKKTVACLREPSLGPCFGMKGGAAGGGYSQVIPMEDINLHFTGDFHAVTSAHNLLAALLDNSLYWDNPLDLKPGTVEWKRVIDMNDRALRDIVVSLGKKNGNPRETGFDITVASEIMAILCLATGLEDLMDKLGRITLGRNRDKERVFARALDAQGAMGVLLKQAILPNLVQTLEQNPVFIHGGPFANIAHGCSSAMATKMGLQLADYTVTEAGFGADLGAEKFFDIKCRKAGLRPDAAVIVATVRALKMHGGVGKKDLGREDPAAVGRGLANLRRHLENLAKFGVPVVVCLNHFHTDTEAEIEVVLEACRELGVRAHLCKHWAEGSAGTVDLARSVVEVVEEGTADFQPLYDSSLSLIGKIDAIAKGIYRARDVQLTRVAMRKIEQCEEDGFGDLPICMAKTQYSFSNDPELIGAPEDHLLEVRDVVANTGAGFLVALSGEIMRMPGLPRIPSAAGMSVDADGVITGLS